MGLVLGMLIVTILVGVSGAFLALALAGTKQATERTEGLVLGQALDGSVALAITKIERAETAGTALPASLTGALTSGAMKGATWYVDVKKSTTDPTLFKLSAASGNREAFRAQQVVVEIPTALPPIPGSMGGALTSYWGFTGVKNITINGNDVTDGGAAPTSPENTYAVATATGGGVAFQNASGQLLGNGTAAPAGTTTPQTVETGFGGFQTEPLQVLGLPAYPANAVIFNDKASWDAWAAANPNPPANSFLVLTFQTGDTTMFGTQNWTGDNILVWHHDSATLNAPPQPSGDATAQNIHIGSAAQPFKGIVLLDDWVHVDGSSSIRGACISLYGAGSQAGLQGNDLINFSSQSVGLALSLAGQVPPPPSPARVISYREGVNDAEGRASLLGAGVIDAAQAALLSLESSAEVSTGWTQP